MYKFKIDKDNYHNCKSIYKRYASRGIASKDGKFVLIRSEKYGEYKFPGGGINPGESQIDALIREYKEETGIDIIVDSIKPFAEFKELRKSNLYDELFDHTSYYYLVEIDSKIGETNLDDYEEEYGYNLVIVDIEEAIKVNEYILKNNDTSMCPWVERELIIFKKLKEIKDGIHS